MVTTARRSVSPPEANQIASGFVVMIILSGRNYMRPVASIKQLNIDLNGGGSPPAPAAYRMPRSS